MTTAGLHAALRACARGLYPAEAGVELLISHASWLHRNDFRDRFVHLGTSITDNGQHRLARRDHCARRRRAALLRRRPRLLRLAASLADVIPVDLRDTLTGLDTPQHRTDGNRRPARLRPTASATATMIISLVQGIGFR